ncbi:MAG: photosynthetic reaction center subunit H [Burkholderiales bacterium]|jgi:photosynthetic reaction center H subunit
MEFGAFTGYVDLAQVLLYLFWMFFAGLIYYLARENHREGYPMESDSLGTATIRGWPIPEPKTFKLADGHEVTVPELARAEPKVSASVTGASPGSPIEPTGDPMLAGVGAGAWANRADKPDLTAHGDVKIVPLRVATSYQVSGNDPDPRGLPVMGADGVQAGTVRDIWLDQSEMMFRYLEVETSAENGSRRVLLPIPFARIRRDRIEVNSIMARHFAQVPATRSPDQVTFLEEDRISAYYGGGTLYADPKRSEPIL